MGKGRSLELNMSKKALEQEYRDAIRHLSEEQVSLIELGKTLPAKYASSTVMQKARELYLELERVEREEKELCDVETATQEHSRHSEYHVRQNRFSSSDE